jgi:hypothetical protein
MNITSISEFQSSAHASVAQVQVVIGWGWAIVWSAYGAIYTSPNIHRMPTLHSTSNALMWLYLVALTQTLTQPDILYWTMVSIAIQITYVLTRVLQAYRLHSTTFRLPSKTWFIKSQSFIVLNVLLCCGLWFVEM